MANKIAALLPTTQDRLHAFGGRLQLARRRRRLTAKQVAERAGMSPMTLRSLEGGGSGVTIGAYLSVMQVLGIEKDLDLLASVDPVGRELQDADLPVRGKASTPAPLRELRSAAPAEAARSLSLPSDDALDWRQHGGFDSADALVALLSTAAPSKRKRR